MPMTDSEYLAALKELKIGSGESISRLNRSSSPKEGSPKESSSKTDRREDHLSNNLPYIFIANTEYRGSTNDPFSF
jgi:hypothetical protein